MLFGTAGVPISAKERSSESGLEKIKELGLGGMELEFVRGVKMQKDTAKKISEISKKKNLVITAHGPYYINLSSLEDAKIKASVNRILETARIANLCNGHSITFHAGFYLGAPPETVYSTIKKELTGIVETLKQENNKIWIRPETTGKETQFGSLKELISLSKEIDQVLPCIDFAHLHARENGRWNTENEFREILLLIEKELGKQAINDMHIHMAGIEYGPKGEKNHLNLKESDLNYLAILKVLKEFNAKGIIICESPNIEEDALLMKKEFEKL